MDYLKTAQSLVASDPELDSVTFAFKDKARANVVATAAPPPVVIPPVPPVPPKPQQRIVRPLVDLIAAIKGNKFLEPNCDYDLGSKPLAFPLIGGVLGMDPKFIGQPKPRILFHPGFKDMPAKFDPTAQGQSVLQAFRIQDGAQIAHVDFVGTNSAQMFLADHGQALVDDVYVVTGAGLGTMGGAQLLTVSNTDGVAVANMLYTGHGGNNGKLVLRNFNLSGGMTNEHGLRTHALDELDWDGGTLNGSGSLQGKDVLTIHELRTKGWIRNVTIKGWATIGGLKPESPGQNDKAVVRNLAFSNVNFVPCIRSSPDPKSADFNKKNGARLYFLAGVENFLYDGGSIEAFDSPCVLWTSDGASAARKAPTGTIKNVTAKGPGKFTTSTAGLTVTNCSMNGKAQ